MRSAVIILMSSLLPLVTMRAQEMKPEIVGQKELSTEKGKPITIQLTDLYVEETPVQKNEGDNGGDGGDNDSNDNTDGNGGNPNNGDSGDGNGDGDGDDNDDSDRGEDENNDGHNDDGHDSNNDDGEDESEGDDKDDDDKKDGKDKKDDKGGKDDKGEKGNKEDKGNKGNRGEGQNGTGETTYPEGYTLLVFDGKNYNPTGNTVYPEAGFTGVLTVPLRVRNAKWGSPMYHLKITVTEPSSANVPPQITGQLPLSVSVNQPVKLALTQLLVSDPDNEYPADFTLKAFPGTNYSLDGTTVIPQRDFTGDLTVNVSVSDGIDESDIFPLRVTVTADVNVKPVITGQAGLRILQGASLEIKLSHLVVEDPDNRYPEDFMLIVSNGDNYSVSNRTIAPDQGFLGMLTVQVSVHDGKASSDPFALKIQVISDDKLEIVGQNIISVPEDSSVAIAPKDLIVNDPSNRYPEGFTIEIKPGEDYKVSGNRIIPGRDFSGNLTVPVAVRHGSVSSASFGLLIIVDPVNDPPELNDIPPDPLVVSGRGTWPLFPGATLIDVDDEHVLFAEIGFRDGMFDAGSEKIGVNPLGELHIVFDESTGVLYVVGRGSLNEYQDLIRSVTYDFQGSPDSLLTAPRHIYVKLNDGKTTSAEYERGLMFNSEVELDIPTAFTPNNDNANDTWEVTPLQQGEQINTFIRVYDKKGNMVFESDDLQQGWDGHYNGSPLPADVYFYTIEMDLAYRKISYKGIVSILR